MPLPSDDPSWWFCCLAVAERTIMRQTSEGLALTLYLGIPLPVWDAFWLATLHNTTEYKSVFRTLYHLEIGTMEIEGSLVDAVVVVAGFTGFWLAVTLFVVSPFGACLSGCEQTQLP